jgi:peptidoglycan/xylan/chitin deacetylase (PgdA/CDA1 family)
MIRARRAWNLLRARTRGGGVILLYHRVARSAHDPFGLCVSPENFASHMEILARLARPTPLRALAPAPEGIPPRSVAVTFDDAYHDVLTEALPVLEGSRVPATVFAVSGELGSTFWWDRMTRIPPDAATAYLGEGPSRKRGSREQEPGAIFGRLHARLLPLPPEERDRILLGLSADAPPEPSLPRALAPEELRRLQGSGTVEIGAHTRTHPNLAALAEADQEVEVTGSRLALEEILGTPVTSFAYPFGTFAHYSRATSGIVEAAGFERACTAEPGVVARGGDAYALPRLWVEDWGADRFRQRLMAWLR